jgi:hypothetical protein
VKQPLKSDLKTLDRAAAQHDSVGCSLGNAQSIAAMKLRDSMQSG